MVKKFKKIICSTILFGSLLTTLTVPVMAEVNTKATDPVNFSFKSLSNGLGYVDGSKNNAYHTLIANNKASLNVTSKSGDGTIYVSLKRGNLSYGTVSVNGSGNYAFNTKTDVTSSKYYLYANGSKANQTYKLTGSLVH